LLPQLVQSEAYFTLTATAQQLVIEADRPLNAAALNRTPNPAPRLDLRYLRAAPLAYKILQKNPKKSCICGNFP
jgi:hypothetical protein